VKSALDLHQALLARGVRHEVVRLTTPATTADDLPRLLGVDRSQCVAVRCYKVDGARTPDGAAVHLAAVAVRAGDTPDSEDVRLALDARAVRPATPDEVSCHTDYAASLVGPLALPEDVVVLADSALARQGADPQGAMYCATGESGTALALRLRDLLVESRARVASLTPTRLLDRPDWRSDGAQIISFEDALVERQPVRATGGAGRPRGSDRSAG
jgi:prolyl-tRNA editing enzyme YbaK/EbsC (Cys-tRNA(Pro) deacylase)